MVQVKRGYVFGACVTSIVAVVLSIASISTDYWVQADLKSVSIDVGQEVHTVRYGLFGGIFLTSFANSKTAYEVTMTCLYGENACALLCRATKEDREQELQDLIDVKYDEPGFECPYHAAKSFAIPQVFKINHKSSESRSFLNAACYLSTVIFLSISIGFGLLTSGLLVWNTIGNPVQTYFSIYSLYYYIAVAAITILVTIIIWGAMFAATIVENVGLLYTISHQMRNRENPILGFSYWLNLGSMFMYMASYGLLMARKYIIENKTTIHRNIDQGNQVIF